MKALSYNAFTLKIIAVVAMIMNHIAIGLQPVLPPWLHLVFFAVGGATYVIMAFFVVEGYRHTSNLGKYIGRLLIFGLIAQAFHPTVLGTTSMVGGPIFLNIMFTITLSLLVLLAYDKIKIRPLFWLLFLVACAAAMFMDLIFMAVLGTLLYHIIKKESRRRTLPGVITGIFYLVLGATGLFGVLSIEAMQAAGMYQEAQVLIEQLGGYSMMAYLRAAPTFAIGAFLGAILIRNFNGERGLRAKWLFYVAYPVHLAVIAAIMVALGISAFNLFGFFTF
ncbi:MAG: conjugal transfer protein TraX [Oscillospiraceae bacterium]|nr:conjugal transfer protein TraX [Oscillospiraceae bacterium]